MTFRWEQATEPVRNNPETLEPDAQCQPGMIRGCPPTSHAVEQTFRSAPGIPDSPVRKESS